MPSLRKRVSTFLRQLSFHQDPRQKTNFIDNDFVSKYLQGQISLKDGPQIFYGKSPTDLPNYELDKYDMGYESIIGCYSGPNGGLTTVKRKEKHLTLPDANIDFIDTQDESVQSCLPKKSPKKLCGHPVDNTQMVIKVAGREYCVTNKTSNHQSKYHSLENTKGSCVEIEKTKINKEFYISKAKCSKSSNLVNCKNLKKDQSGQNHFQTKRNEYETKAQQTNRTVENRSESQIPLRSAKSSNQSHNKIVKLKGKTTEPTSNLTKSKCEGSSLHYKKRGNIISLAQRPTVRDPDSLGFNEASVAIADADLPPNWNKKSNLFYGISDSLYDLNQVTKIKNGDPIADCFGLIVRKDSAILAVADGVNWGEKASVAAKSAVYGCLYYLNHAIFNDIKAFENLILKSEDTSEVNVESSVSLINNTREVFVCLLRAFHCAHDFILENRGMLTTLTVAVILPLQKKKSTTSKSREYGDNAKASHTEEDCSQEQYVCCVCNVGDTLAYVYSPKYGVRELTKGSHDINCNRDIRDALGALGPVDGINPELSNLTLSISTLSKGDIVLVASDGLTDNLDPNVCKFSVNSSAKVEPAKEVARSRSVSRKFDEPPINNARTNETMVPVKPPRKSRLKQQINQQNQIKSLSDKRSGNKCNIDNKEAKPLETHFHSASNRKKSVDDSVKSDNVQQKVPGTEISKCNENEKVNLEKSNESLDTATCSFNNNPLVAEFMRQNFVDKVNKIDKEDLRKESSAIETKKIPEVSSIKSLNFNQAKQESSHSMSKPLRHATNKPIQEKADSNTGYKFMRSKTALDFSMVSKRPIKRNNEGVAFVTPLQRYELQLLLMEDILKHGISGRESPCTAAKEVCENLVNFTFNITAAKRRTLEDQEMYFDNLNGVLVEVSQQEQKLRRRKGLESVLNLPGKLDHVSIVAWNVGNYTK